MENISRNSENNKMTSTFIPGPRSRHPGQDEKEEEGWKSHLILKQIERLEWEVWRHLFHCYHDY